MLKQYRLRKKMARYMTILTEPSSTTNDRNSQFNTREWMALLPIGVVVLNDQGVVVDANPVAIDLLGIPLLYQSWRDVIARAFAPRNDDGHEVSLHDGRRVKIVTRALSDGNGQLIALADLTDSRELQSRVAQRERLASMGNLVASLAHQLRTPISSALLYAHQLHVQGENQLAARLIDRLQYMERQIADMLLIAGGGEAIVEPISIPSVLAVLREQFETPLQQRHIAFEIQHLSGRSSMLGNPDAIIGALANVIENAAQACEEDEKLTHHIVLRTRRRNGCIEFDIRDNGKGMTDAVRARAIDPFFTTKRKGTGLGLAVVNAVTQSHHGQLSIHSELGKGSQFVLSFPIYRTQNQNLNAATGVAA